MKYLASFFCSNECIVFKTPTMTKFLLLSLGVISGEQIIDKKGCSLGVVRRRSSVLSPDNIESIRANEGVRYHRQWSGGERSGEGLGG